MTTSQASRIFGIPYNSLLMYVRGKYGKSLKLEQLKKNCLVGGGRGGPLQGELLPPVLGVGRGPYLAEGEEGGGSSRDMESTLPLDPYAQLYSEFGSFPIPVGMIHLLPQSEKNREFPAEMEKREKKKSGKRRERREERREARLGEEKMADEGEGRGGKEVEEVVMKMKEEYQNREGVRGVNLCDGAEVVGHGNERRPDPMVCD
ncbi:hypothetical protein J437_LFUL014596 [Ladona fulva]|uniref:HTH psq-type domain-containing protein n=1 Tax=Ladona fulva TaxID=123851 RepID=A0A8K0P671_LADFU|nr:hypothetical protein J437_LFUL014596 [Ladona fulva]